MSIIFVPSGRVLIVLALLLIVASSPRAALDAKAAKVLADGSRWTVNIDGSEHSIRLHGDEQRTGSFGWIRRGISGNGGKGLLRLQWRGHTTRLKMTVPVSRGRQATCTGHAARDLSFLTGYCGGRTPFVMTPRRRESRSKGHVIDRDVSHRQKILRVATITSHASHKGGREDARDIAREASRHIPYRTQGGDCGKCDSVMTLDVPRNPPGNSQEGRWLAALLEAQSTAIGDMFDRAGRRELRTQEANICESLRKCVAIFRQSVIAAAAEKLGGTR